MTHKYIAFDLHTHTKNIDAIIYNLNVRKDQFEKYANIFKLIFRICK